MNLILSVLVTLSVVATIIFSTQSAVVESADSPSRDVFRGHINLTTVRENFKAQLEHPEAFSITRSNSNNGFQCIESKSFCSSSPKEVRIVFTPTGGVHFDSRIHGFNLKGERCNLSTNDCDILLSMNWSPKCSGGCNNPEVVVDFNFSSNRSRVLDLSKFNFEVEI